MTPSPSTSARAAALLTLFHTQQLRGARIAMHRLLLMRVYADCLRALGCEVRPWEQG